jgi:hypothetical protein
LAAPSRPRRTPPHAPTAAACGPSTRLEKQDASQTGTSYGVVQFYFESLASGADTPKFLKALQDNWHKKDACTLKVAGVWGAAGACGARGALGVGAALRKAGAGSSFCVF